ncbi:phosphoenolpyruvate carboxykinase (ATP) [Natronobiforma cellulositropha]|uniref:hypothetical protein n=1 Tax=Natronobiforma cellulositropha TaxID=1679076 RepID=UPI0021D57F68|nr:hypothetical protein [Natronobiforma cellulositropha]
MTTDASDRWVYEVYGRRVESTVELPRLAGRRAPATDTTPDLTVRRGHLARTPETLERRLECVYTDSAGEVAAYRDGRTLYWLAPGVATLRVEAERVTVDPAPEATAEALGRLVTSPGLRSALSLAGAFVVHASAVATDGRAVAFTGPSGRGKSTAAAACHAAGYEVLGDDAAVLESHAGTPVVVPGVPVLETGSTTVDASGRTRPDVRPLAAVFVLEEGDRWQVTERERRCAAVDLLAASDALYAATDAARAGAALETAGALASAVPVYRLVRPRSHARLAALPDVVEATLEDVAGSAVSPRKG